ncbi:ladinin-1 [Aulostomus maculatus]
MSISRKNWSALSSLTRQWTMEDEEEVERERRRRVKSSSSTADPDADFNATLGATPTDDITGGTDLKRELSPSSTEQMNLDFVEMLRVRDERRRMRHVEALRRQKEVGEDGVESSGGEGGRDMDEDRGSVSPSVTTTSNRRPPSRTTSYSNSSTTTTTSSGDASANNPPENGASSGEDPDPKLPSKPAHKFVSSVSISIDKSPSASGRTTPMSPQSPMSPRGHWPSPCQSPLPRGPQSPVHNGHTQTSGRSFSSSSSFEQTSKPAFVRQSSRTISFRMMRKKEEESAPLQRSASVRMASKKFEPSSDQHADEDKAPSFQRNSRHRISSRSIQEKMERLAQAAQKSEMPRSPDVTQRTLLLMDGVSRRRGLFEKEQQAASPSSPEPPRQDLRHVDISSKRSLFERAGEERVPKNSPAKLHK